jgi:hypothetical protein
VDTHSRKQKRTAREANGWQQAEMFSQRDITQFGVRDIRRCRLLPQTQLELAVEDPRSEEGIEADRQREIESKTSWMFRERPGSYIVSGQINELVLFDTAKEA